jgi:hypothetical protein
MSLSQTTLLCSALALQPCSGNCTEPTTQSAVSGEIRYVTGEGTTLSTTKVDLWGSSASKIDLRTSIGDRPLQILIDRLASGSTKNLAHDESAKACLSVQGGAPPACLLLDGSVEVRKLDKGDCKGNENITMCADDVDLTIHATSHDLGLSLAIDLDVVEATKWTPSTCGPD